MPKDKKTIMIVDDEENLLDLVKTLLDPKYDVIISSNGDDTLKKLESITPDLVVVDLMMPEMDGITLCKNIRKNPKTKHLKLMMLTVVTKEELSENIIKTLKLSKYMAKPFENKAFLDSVEKIINTK